MKVREILRRTKIDNVKKEESQIEGYSARLRSFGSYRKLIKFGGIAFHS